jgi:hypothetical protein
MEKAKNYKTNRIPRIAAVMLYLVLLTTWLLSGLSAKFIAGDAASDEARVAAFDVTTGSTMSHNFAVTMQPGESSEDITVSVKNSGETAVSYTIAFELDGNLPLTAVLVDDGTAALSQESGKTIWHTKAAELAGSQKSYTFRLKWDASDNAYRYADGIESVTVALTAAQED